MYIRPAKGQKCRRQVTPFSEKALHIEKRWNYFPSSQKLKAEKVVRQSDLIRIVSMDRRKISLNEI